jgi:hypothetical protein
MTARRVFVLVGAVTVIKPEFTTDKYAFDVCYYPCLDATRGRPFGLYVHGNEGTEGAERGVTAITTGLGWVKAAEHVVVSGKPSKGDLESCWELGATVAAQLMG